MQKMIRFLGRLFVGGYFISGAAFCGLHSVSADEPRVQALVPGLHIQRLPVTLTNIDSVAYGPDGRLFAAGYDGRVHVLTDTDGDGVEDKGEVYWSKPGDLLTPVGILANEDGVYVAARGKIALLKDTNGDGKADKSETVVSGWVKEKYNGDTRNDAAGIMIDKDGQLYFSLGCTSYNKAWLLNENGKSQYDPTSERGTILKVSPDRKKREILATGLRFVIGLDINKHGDLFATDQEGDTWFPGGNPRDELLHIIPGRHYGFPFRHAKHLPDSIDEPYVVGFSPQHQSTCGFRFNEVRPGRGVFGPDHWEGNAIVTGFSRGKLWRTPLAKTRAGYVGRQVQIAAFESLLTDVAISPSGDLLITGHSGSPDWGAGPGADGHLYKISFDRQVPQPVIAWSASPIEMKIAFDQPVDPRQLKTAGLEAGEFAREGDRYEWIFPGYDVVKAEKRAVRREIKVSSIGVSPDRRTVTLVTAPQPWNARYNITLPGVAAANSNKPGEQIEVSSDMGGVQAEWTPLAGATSETTATAWRGWLPHIDTNVIRTMTAGSASHEQLMHHLGHPGSLVMKSQLLLPGKEVTLRWEASQSFAVRCGEKRASSRPENGRHIAELNISAANSPAAPKNSNGSARPNESDTAPARGDRIQILPTHRVPLEIRLTTGPSDGDFEFNVSYRADFDPHERPLRLEHLFVPWAPTIVPQQTPEETRQSLAKVDGDPAKGREIFFGKKAGCSQCHMFAGQGGKVAADLTVSLHRSPEAVLRDIVSPSASINPDYVSYTVATADGKTLTGLFQTANEDKVVLIDNKAQPHTIDRAEIEDIRPSSVSLMPAGFDKLGKDDLQNLVAFLCTEDAATREKGLPTGVILREQWNDIPGGLAALQKHADFPDKPSSKNLVTRFEGTINGPEYYGSRIRGYVHPPQTGDYTFWMAADDEAELWLSTTDNPNDKVRIVSMKRWTPSRLWDRYPEQKSKPVRLEAGRRYYIEAIQHEARVDDCLAVGWQLPDKSLERPIPGRRLSTPGE